MPTSAGYSNNSLKAAQLRAVNRMLAFNDDSYDGSADQGINVDDYSLPPAGSSHNQWKILIYDVACRSIISPLLSVAQLRRRGVTLHLLLHSDREPIPDVPAVYFCQPTPENLSRIAQDCSQRLYGRAHLNFCTKLSRSAMEDFGRLVVQANALDQVASVHDQYLDYVCLERNLFSLHRTDSYVTYNGSGATDQSMEAAMNEIAHGLFSVVASLGHVPIIRCARNGAPEMVARKLHKMIREHPTLMRGSGKAYRPLMVLMDRNADLVTPIQHASTYQALIDDMLSHRANRVEFMAKKSAESTTAQVPKKYDLNPDEDPFYAAHKFNPFPEAIEQNGVELQEVTQRESAIRSSAGGTSTIDNATDDLAMAVDSLPALLDRKKQLEVHTTILQAVMAKVAARDVPQFYELESGLASGSVNSEAAKSETLELLTDPSKGNIHDKLRLALVYILTSNAANSELTSVAEAMREALETKGATAEGSNAQRGLLSAEDRATLSEGMKAIQYVMQLRSMTNVSMMIPQEAEDVSSKDSSSDMNLSYFMKNATNQATGLLAKASEKVGSMLIGKSYKHPLTRIVENLCDFKANSEDDTYLYLDAKIATEVNVSMVQATNRAPVKDVLCFTIGGGCYTEYQNLQLLKSSSDSVKQRTITYGSTELLAPDKFLKQLGKLA